ncbi:MAG: ribonuclease HII [Betaproteobacteria bacterium]
MNRLPATPASRRKPVQEQKEEFRAAMLQRECEARRRGISVLCGLDEAGRGPLAGPVVAAAVILPENCYIVGVRDSKALSPHQRERLYREITRQAVDFSVGVVDAEGIDQLNILRATHRAMCLAVAGLRPRPELALVDGLPVPGLPVPHEAMVDGDALCHLVAAASIVAKVTRDRIMAAYDALYPEYGFAHHKGYGTPAHLERLRRYGPCPLHRRSFAPVAEVADSGIGRLF